MKTFLILLLLAAQICLGDVHLTQGEKPLIYLTAESAATAIKIVPTAEAIGTPFNLTGATFQTKFLKTDGSAELIISNASHTIVNAGSGAFTLDLNSADTTLLQVGSSRSFVVIVTLASKNYYFWARKNLTVYSPYIKDQ